MDRCHLYLPLVDSSGIPYPFADVTLLDMATGLPISTPVYLEPVGGNPQTWPILVSNPAVVSLWTDTPLRCTLLAALPSGATMTRVGIDIVPPPTGTVRTDRPVTIESTDGIDSSAILSVSPIGEATWGLVDALQYHRHGGDSEDSAMVGMTGYSDVYPGQVWVGSAPGAPSALQGPDTVAIGAAAQVDGQGAVALGHATAAGSSVAVGATATAGASSVALGPAASATGSGQVALGKGASASAGAAKAVAIGSGVVAAAGSAVTIGPGIKLLSDGTLVLGYGSMPDLTGLSGTVFLAIVGELLMPQYARLAKDASLAGAASTFGAFGAGGSTRPILSSSGVTGATAGHDAILSLLAALDGLGLIYLTDNAIDDQAADFTLTATHTNISLDTGDASGFYAGDTARFKRTTSAAGEVTYSVLASDIKDFNVRVFSSSPVDITAEVLAWLSPDGTTWTPVTLAWQPLITTVSPWVQTWCTNARPLPSGMRYLKLQIGANAATAAPQIGRVLIRTWSPILYGTGLFGDGLYGG